jgi:hypothetical protein
MEMILCAANWYPELEFPKPIEGLASIYWLPQNIGKGIVFSGRHHLQCMYQAYQMTGLKQHELVERQGFLTSHNRWVTRDEAGEIAFKAGQIKSPKHLFSEDFGYPYPQHEKREVPPED